MVDVIRLLGIAVYLDIYICIGTLVLFVVLGRRFLLCPLAEADLMHFRTKLVWGIIPEVHLTKSRVEKC